MMVHKNGKFRRREFRCELCDKMFVSANSLRGHNRNIHQSESGRSAQEDVFKAESDDSSEES
jgi:transposase-like protein